MTPASISDVFFSRHQFDGIIGFSQGGMVASLIAKVLAGVDAGCEPELNISTKVNKGLSFVIFGSVMQFDPNNSLDQVRKDLQQMSQRWSKLQQPPFHVLSIWGTKDKFFSQDDFKKMSRTNNSGNIATFPFGHSIPNK